MRLGGIVGIAPEKLRDIPERKYTRTFDPCMFFRVCFYCCSRRQLCLQGLLRRLAFSSKIADSATWSLRFVFLLFLSSGYQPALRRDLLFF